MSCQSGNVYNWSTIKGSNNSIIKVMKKLVFLIMFLQFWTNLNSQNFPPPTNFYAIPGSDSIELFWMPPENKSLSHYNIYYCGYYNGLPAKIGSTTNTYYSTPFPTFGNTIKLGVSTEYIDPFGESDTLWSELVIPLLWVLPVEVNFEDPSVYFSGLTTSIMAGSDNWELIDSVFYSHSHAAAFNSILMNSKASLITTVIGLTSEETPSLSFMCKLPPKNGLSDTLKLHYLSAGNWVQVSDPLFNIDDWQFFTFSLESMPLSFHFAFEAIAGGGNGIYLDDIIFEDKTVSVQDHKFISSTMKVEQNPVASVLTLDLNLKEASQCSFVLYTIEGHTVKSVEEQFIENGNQKISIDVSDLNAGLYIVEAKFNNQITSRKIVKN